MTRKEAIRQTEQERALMSLGFTSAEAGQLRRISMTLHRWHERQCGDGNGCVEVDDDGTAWYYRANHSYVDPRDPRARYRIPNRGLGAYKRLIAIVNARNTRVNPNMGKDEALSFYVQTDPRGAALYILRPGDVPEGKSTESYYTRGIVVY